MFPIRRRQLVFYRTRLPSSRQHPLFTEYVSYPIYVSTRFLQNAFSFQRQRLASAERVPHPTPTPTFHRARLPSDAGSSFLQNSQHPIQRQRLPSPEHVSHPKSTPIIYTTYLSSNANTHLLQNTCLIQRLRHKPSLSSPLPSPSPPPTSTTVPAFFWTDSARQYHNNVYSLSASCANSRSEHVFDLQDVSLLCTFLCGVSTLQGRFDSAEVATLISAPTSVATRFLVNSTSHTSVLFRQLDFSKTLEVNISAS